MAQIVYEWGALPRPSLDVQRVGQEIERLRRVSKVNELPKNLVAAARSKRHFLHSQFEWDDSVAGERYRIDQAKKLISIVIETRTGKDGQPIKVKSFPMVVVEGKRTYTTMEIALSDAKLRNQLVAEALQQLEGWVRRHRNYVELAELAEAIEEAMRRTT